jgi:hypothetical protein
LTAFDALSEGEVRRRSMPRRFIAVLISSAMLTVSTQSLQAFPNQLRSRWDELPHMIEGMNIRMILPDSTVIRGQTLEVRPDELIVDVRRTSNPRLHAKGLTKIPRSDVSTIELFLRRPPGAIPDAGAMGAGLGGVAVSPLLFYLGETNQISGWPAAAIFFGAAAAGAIMAQLHGADTSRVLIIVAP